MAGRGRHIGISSKESKKPVVDNESEVPTLINMINDIDVNNSDEGMIYKCVEIFSKVCVLDKSLDDVISVLHFRALCDSDFVEKLIHFLYHVLYFEVNNKSVKKEIIIRLQKDFEEREILSQKEHKRFLNAVMLLGHYSERMTNKGVGVTIFLQALLEYFEMLLVGKEEDLKVLVTQVLLNGKFFKTSNETIQTRYECLTKSLRYALVNRDLKLKSRCWILLAIDILSGDCTLPDGMIRDFYIQNLGEKDYSNLESLMKRVSAHVTRSGVLKQESLTPLSKEDNNLLEVKSADISLSDFDVEKVSDFLIQTKEKVNSGVPEVSFEHLL